MSLPTDPNIGDGPGVPEARSRALGELGERLGAQVIDRVWVFAPMVRGRREWGLLALSCFREGAPDRSLLSLRYSAELTGQGLEYSSELVEEGDAPADRIPRVIEGVVRRSEDSVPGPAKMIEIGGSVDRLARLLEEVVVEP